MKALALFSGGLDSSLAIKLISEQGIEVIALNFVSHFFGGKNERAERMAKQLGVKLEYIDFKALHTDIVREAPHGRGKNMNPCIDCHSLMFKYAAEVLLEKFDASFIISGEVLGQRPMSQNKSALNQVKKLSGYKDLIVRPLCAKLLEPSLPEREGWIDREKLLDINGRSRQIQMELAEKFGITEYPSPGGGCMLTEPNYSKRLKILENDGCLYEEYSYLFYLLRYGRFFRLDEKKYLFVGRENDDNLKISEYKDKGSLHIVSAGIPGPAILGIGNFTIEEIEFAKQIFSRYSKNKGKEKINVLVNDNVETVSALNLKEIENKIKKYIILGN
ncbi:tRNA-specific 2-thiouridylase [Hypnocyclicus thermotrophus]|uniref:tRNA-specific 2-thiouridylase n=1 Tax=Hypnocyclicus thermotrophus TaxID=1627895 RepID=A0AA46DYS8_9FUSO|nr:7-cyano-7-deazaguanine synthase [Hypnocyclicus thermotrophus]TDT70529.1 tRNA-specific 2-thiouridylase [Hypnocyclicus thermotrophus]